MGYNYDDTYSQAILLHLDGYSCTKIGEILNLNRKKISHYLKDQGYKIRVMAGNHNKEEIQKKYLEGENMFLKGKSINKISMQLKINKKSFSNWLQEERNHKIKSKRGLTIREKEDQNRKLIFAESLINEGHSFSSAVKESKANYYNLKKFLKEKGYKLIFSDRKYSLTKNIFETVNNKEKAYWLGFLYADAYVTTDCRYVLEVTLKSEDLEHLVKLRDFLGSDHPIIPKEVKLNGNIFKVYRLAIYSKQLVEDLVRLGCMFMIL